MPSRDSGIRSTPPHDAIYRVVFLSIIRSTQINMKSTTKHPRESKRCPLNRLSNSSAMLTPGRDSPSREWLQWPSSGLSTPNICDEFVINKQHLWMMAATSWNTISSPPPPQIGVLLHQRLVSARFAGVFKATSFALQGRLFALLPRLRGAFFHERAPSEVVVAIIFIKDEVMSLDHLDLLPYLLCFLGQADARAEDTLVSKGWKVVTAGLPRANVMEVCAHKGELEHFHSSMNLIVFEVSFIIFDSSMWKLPFTLIIILLSLQLKRIRNK